MSFLSSPLAIGDYELIAGTRRKDSLSGYGAQAVLGGLGNDRLTGYSVTSRDGLWQIPPLLSGGRGNDRYDVVTGAFTVIADLGGGKDTVNTSMKIENISFALVNGRDVLATDGGTTVLLIDPLGLENPNNRIEQVKLGRKTYKTSKLYDMALRSDAFIGSVTYTDLQTAGYLNLSQAGLDPLAINDYIQAARINNDLVG